MVETATEQTSIDWQQQQAESVDRHARRNELPALRGSEKQVKWAGAIRMRACGLCERILSSEYGDGVLLLLGDSLLAQIQLRRIGSKETPLQFQQAFAALPHPWRFVFAAECAPHVKAWLCGETEARWWIEMREILAEVKRENGEGMAALLTRNVGLKAWAAYERLVGMRP